MKKIFLLTVILLVSISVSFSQGIVRGKITDKTGETLIGVTIVLKSNRSYGVVTDFDGNYSLKIADSTAQSILVSYVSYQTAEAIVHPLKGQVIIKNFVLESAAQDMKEIEITAKAVKAKDYYMEKLKINSSVTMDYVSSETMKKTGDANVVAAVARVSGVSTNGSFITVRGIGDRYVKTTINGSRIPTLDPFTNNIKLDMFPSSLVDNIIISKTASPDLPGDWSGAYLSVETKDYPENLSVNVETSAGYNNQTSFKDVLTSQRSSTDWLGYDNGLRDNTHSDFIKTNPYPTQYQEFVALGLGNFLNAQGITKDTPWNDTYYKLALVELGLLGKAQLNDPVAITNAKNEFKNDLNYKDKAFNLLNADGVKSGQGFSNNWNVFKRKAPLNFTQSFSIGNQMNLFGRPFGFLAGFRYGNSIIYDPQSTANRASVNASGDKGIASSLNQQVSKEANGWSALFNIAYKFNSNHSVSLLFMPNLTGVNNIRNSSENDDAGGTYDSILTKSQFYEERKQMVYQFKSEHYLPSAKMKIELNASYTNGKSNAPDFKNLQISSENGVYSSKGGTDRFFRYLSEELTDVRLSAELPLGNPALVGARKLKFGGAYQDNKKKSDQYDYVLNNYALGGANTGGVIIENNNIDEFFNLNHFGISKSSDGYSKIDRYYTENANPANHTFGYSTILAGFVLMDYTIVSSLRVSGGLRVEHAKIYTDVYKYDSLALAPMDSRRQYTGEIFTPSPGKLNEFSLLPSANIIYKVKSDELAPVNLRLNFSQTVARPSIRELSETVVKDFEFRANVFGNSDLKMVRINNYDIRLESYFKSGDNISMSLFFKNFKNHIELVSAGNGFTWINVDKSFARGIELEGKKNLTKHLEFRANVTFVKSQTTFIEKILQVNGGIKTYIPVGEVKRSMFGQAPYVINGVLGYSLDSLGLTIALSYNVQGPRLVLASGGEIPDIYELARHLVDFKVSKKLGKYFSTSFTVKDILKTSIRRSYNYSEGWLLDFDKFTYGTNFVLGLSYKL